ncbi:Rrf2 family transcriptional regulator [bacterium endosymbiont of Bathymodiolus sp. 5 South]|jgi:Rrf2 family iron-sulfur cluster assembly transcriptional regulator|uniref:Rrf2 family transcriptional regulator n=1 Tax=bacterium endosymbiont of Bathymodiolus sp. 5 South TaxID=1181670 RepID=UPI0010BB1310|nr:Rrf2 family transcriptional regulator [bacterium endosymbiont of Bathymodiolus sp. 5 South]CAC9447914.1 Iron-sulfur cluster regulator IscR [uncultured Gammaproteobacteria bacterium]CAC9650271.1 Iron-sulfur cluster regulator IscR [uncultured Gammaproteobacteria bacterium]SHN91732.1 Iron-sulfur cluster regulator IscR [bacterium endosymbiont of Bathymodiolus sp. 5 South]SSC08585.1 Iron-sulfur cluster regulator IscR [bacterium endosymbiont of Bathymodiolus sp. 5 South]VVH56217.1 Iron-sulfur clu
MQLTTKGRYAITAMLDLAANNAGKPITLDFISQRQNISLSYLEQLFAKLRRANLVKSVRGPGGGYLLNTQAKNISLTQIIEAVDENIDLRRCKGMNACNNGKQCISHQLWCDVSKQIRTFLNSKTLQMVIDNHEGQ